jgi:hypothetical protein
MTSIKSNHVATELADLEVLAAKLVETARRLPSGPQRQGIFDEIGKFVVRIEALKAKAKPRS